MASEREVSEAQVLAWLRSTRDLGIGADRMMRETAAKILRDFDNGRPLWKHRHALPVFGVECRDRRFYELPAPPPAAGGET